MDLIPHSWRKHQLEELPPKTDPQRQKHDLFSPPKHALSLQYDQEVLSILSSDWIRKHLQDFLDIQLL